MFVGVMMACTPDDFQNACKVSALVYPPYCDSCQVKRENHKRAAAVASIPREQGIDGFAKTPSQIKAKTEEAANTSVADTGEEDKEKKKHFGVDPGCPFWRAIVASWR